MGIASKEEIKKLFQYPILEAIAQRRTRRFPLGCTSPEGALGHASDKTAVPLNDLETGILCWSGAGVTGSITGDLPTRFFGSTFGSWTGRATPYPCNIHNTRLFFTNDQGAFIYNPSTATKPVEIESPADWDRIVAQYEDGCKQVLDERAEFLPKALGGPMSWNINQPGTTIFMPIVDQVEEYINFLLGLFEREGYGYRIVDDLKGGISAGLQHWIDHGQLKGPSVPLTSFENSLMLGHLAPAYLILENVHLVAEAMGLGSVMFGGYTGQVMLGVTPMSKGLGFQSQTGADGRINPVGLDGFFEAYCPPYHNSMSDAVDAFLEKKYGPGASYTSEYKGVTAFKDWSAVQPDYPRPGKLSVDQVKSVLTYLYETYGRIPVTSDTKLLPVWLQVHHLDLDFYEKHFDPATITAAQRNHMKLWHS
ncbi:hypothetical protein KKI24_02770 [bacterium]|nr:hypothetical protein [bacterium]